MKFQHQVGKGIKKIRYVVPKNAKQLGVAAGQKPRWDAFNIIAQKFQYLPRSFVFEPLQPLIQRWVSTTNINAMLLSCRMDVRLSGLYLLYCVFHCIVILHSEIYQQKKLWRAHVRTASCSDHLNARLDAGDWNLSTASVRTVPLHLPLGNMEWGSLPWPSFSIRVPLTSGEVLIERLPSINRHFPLGHKSVQN